MVSYAPLPAHHFSAMAPAGHQQVVRQPEPQGHERPVHDGGEHSRRVITRWYAIPATTVPAKGCHTWTRLSSAISIRTQSSRIYRPATIDSTAFLDVSQVQEAQRLSNYTLITTPTSADFEALYFNFHNTVLASHLEVRQAMAKAIDHQALLNEAALGFASRCAPTIPRPYIRAMKLNHPVQSLIRRQPISCWTTTAG